MVLALVGLGGLVFLAAAARFAMARSESRAAVDLGLAVAGAAVATFGALLF